MDCGKDCTQCDGCQRVAEALTVEAPGPRAASVGRAATRRPTAGEAEEAVRTLLRWAREDPAREGLRETPQRLVRAYEEWFSGYLLDPASMLKATFDEVDEYDEMVVLRDIRLESFCEHHLAPIIGKVHIGYLPNGRVVGISKLARVVDAYAKRMQIQERLTAQIANCVAAALKPHGVGVVVEASHHCMTTRGVHKPGGRLVSSRMLGAFRTDMSTRREFLSLVRAGNSAE